MPFIISSSDNSILTPSKGRATGQFWRLDFTTYQLLNSTFINII